MNILIGILITAFFAALVVGLLLSFKRDEPDNSGNTEPMIAKGPEPMQTPDSKLVAKIAKGEDFTAVVSDGTITEIKTSEIKTEEKVAQAPGMPPVKKVTKTTKPASKQKSKK